MDSLVFLHYARRKYPENTMRNWRILAIFCEYMHFTLLNVNSDVFSDEIPEMIAHVDPVNSCFCLTDASRPNYIFITNLRKRFGHFLHSASVSLRQQGEENTVDAVQILVSKLLSIKDRLMDIKVRSMRTYLIEYADSSDR